MPVRRNYRINLRNYGNPPAVMVSQYDENYDLVFEVFDGVVPATGLNAYTVKLVGRQPGDDPALKYEFTGTVSGMANNILSFTIDTTMTGKAGKGTAEIVILDTTNDVKFASFNLPVYVEKAAVPDDAIDADVERAQEIADEVQDIVDTAAATVKGEAESWAVGERDGEPVPSTDPTYQNNAKYYAEQAAQIAEDISGVTAQVATNTSDISDLKEDLSHQCFVEQPITFIAGSNVSVQNGVLKTASNANRGRVIIFSSYSNIIRIEGSKNVTYGVHGYNGTEWVANIGNGAKVVDTTGYGLLVIQAVSNTTVTVSDAPHVFYETSALKSEIDSIEKTLTADDFINGYYSGREVKASTTRICLKKYPRVKKGDKIVYDTTLNLAIGIYEDGKTTVTDATGWMDAGTGIYDCQHDGFLLIMLQSDTDITPNDYAGNEITIINTVQARLNYIENLINGTGISKTIAFLGDSLTAGSGTNKAYHMYISEKTGFVCKNYGYGGSGYALSYTGTNGKMATGQTGLGVNITSATKITPNNFASRISTVDTDIDALVIFGGTNDWGNGGSTITVEAFKTAVETTFDYAQTHFGRIPIIVLLPVHRQNDTVPNEQGKTLREYAEIIKNACIDRGIYCINTLGESGLYPDNSNNATLYFTRDDTHAIDGIHPNHYAHKSIANVLLSALQLLD